MRKMDGTAERIYSFVGLKYQGSHLHRNKYHPLRLQPRPRTPPSSRGTLGQHCWQFQPRKITDYDN